MIRCLDCPFELALLSIQSVTDQWSRDGTRTNQSRDKDKSKYKAQLHRQTKKSGNMSHTITDAKKNMPNESERTDQRILPSIVPTYVPYRTSSMMSTKRETVHTIPRQRKKNSLCRNCGSCRESLVDGEPTSIDL